MISDREVIKETIKRQTRALRKMQQIFMEESICSGINCSECLFSYDMCNRLNHCEKNRKPLMANVSLKNLEGGD